MAHSSNRNRSDMTPPTTPTQDNSSGGLRRGDYNVAWICPLPDVELLPARLMLDERHDPPQIDTAYDDNTYICGTVNGHRVVIATLPKGLAGNVNAGRLTGSLFKSFPNIKIALLVGIGGGVPRPSRSNDPLDDVHLGDVVVGWAGDGKPAVVYHDLGRSKVDGEFEMVGSIDKPEWGLVQALGVLSLNQEMEETTFPDQLARLRGKAKFTAPDPETDRLFEASYHHAGEERSDCVSCDPAQLIRRPPRTVDQRATLVFHQGRIATGNSVIRDGELRDRISARCGGVLCVEMEAAGVDVNGRCLVIRGISDYADSHKNDLWKHRAAGNAAAFARELLCTMQAGAVRDMEGTVQGHWHIPFERNQHFVGREAELQQLCEMLSSSEACQRAAIWGLGGCGKTAIALEFAYRTRKLRPRCSVFWVPAISRQSFEEAYRAIGALLQIPGIEDEKADVKGLVQRALSNERAGEWLLVVDNADDVDVLFREGDDESRLIDYLPRSRNGSILFTTRTRKAAIDQVGSQSIELFEMNRAEALEFFSKTLNRKEFLEGDEVSKLLELLAYLPLAIVQAAAFLNKNEVRISEYIGLLRETPDDEIELLSRDFEDRSRYREIRNPVAITWIISFEQIQKHDPLAVRYLSFMACLLREDIPRSLLPRGHSKLEEIEGIGTLTAYAFITRRCREQRQQRIDFFSMHRLVHLATQNWLKKNSQWEFHLNEAVSRLVDSIPYGDHETREVWTAYLPHAVYIMARESCAMGDKLEELLSRVGRCQDMLGQYVAAEKSHRRVHQSRKERLGLEHPDTLTSMFSVAQALGNQGKYGEAEEMHREELALSEKVLGKEHPGTLISVYNLAYLLHKQSRYEEASELYQRAYGGFEQALGSEHPTTTACLNHFSAMQQEATQARLKQSQEPVHDDRTPVSDVVCPEPRSGSASSRQGNKKSSIIMRLKEKFRRKAS